MNRRRFLTTCMTAGALAAGGVSASSCAGADDINASVSSKADLPTPALILDLDAFEANIQKLADHCRQAKCAFRPHAKTHKCAEIAKRQVAAGASGICAATVPEAEAMAEAGIRNILLTSPIVDRNKIARMVQLARSGREIMLALDNARQVELLAAAVEAAQISLDVLIDLDVGLRRTGVQPGEPAVELARLAGRSKRLRLRGVQAYAGNAAHVVGFEKRASVSREAMARAVETNRLLRQAGFDAQMLSGGSTGTYNIDSAIEGVTELQAGSYVFMDVDYRRIGGSDGAAVYADFRPSLTVLTTVVSAPQPGRVTVDAGTKALDTTTSNRPEPKDRPELRYGFSGDEFGSLSSQTGGSLPAIGDRLEIIVPHCDPSVNLYDRLYACRKDAVTAVWPIAARRESSVVK